MSVFLKRRGSPKTPIKTKLASEYSVGESVYLSLNGEDVEFLVVHQGNPDESIYDSSCDGTWLLMKNVYINKRFTTSTTGNFDYEFQNTYHEIASNIKSYIENDLYSLFTEDVTSMIKCVNIPINSNHGLRNIAVTLFILSATELGFTTEDYPSGCQLDLFKSGNNDYRKSSDRTRDDDITYGYWTRNPRNDKSSGSSYEALYVDTEGSLDSSTGSRSSYSARPAMIINSRAVFNSETNRLL